MLPARQTAASRTTRQKPSLSPTRIATYLECAVKYKYIYSDKIGRFYLRARPGLSFGSTLHHVLQDFHRSDGVQGLAEMVETLETTWIGAGYASPEQEQEHRQIGHEIVEAYHAAHQRRVEARAETIAVEKSLGCDMGRFRLVGRVDRIDRYPDGRLEIVDYKSGRWEPSPAEVEADLAMSCYQLIAKRTYPNSRVQATIYNLRSGREATAELSEQALAEFEQDLVVLGERILDRDFSEVVPEKLPICGDCDFFARCSRYWKTHVQSTFAEDGPFFDGEEL